MKQELPIVSSVPQLQWTDTGIILPIESDVLAGVQADINTAFGITLNPALETPQGQLATTMAAVIADKDAQIAWIANQVDPQYADGDFQDGIARIYFITRKPALPTVVTVTLTGLNGTVVPAGMLAQDATLNTYVNTGDATIGSSGTVTATFENIVTGPIPCLAGKLNRVYQAISGWDAITNPSDGVIGRPVETRAEFEYRRQNSVAKNAHGTLDSILGAVFSVSGVQDAYAIQNNTNTMITAGSTSTPLLPHSVYISVIGGTDSDVGMAIHSKKDVGCDMNGNTTYIAEDVNYPPPYPTYQIKFERPSTLPVSFTVKVASNPYLPPDLTTQIQNSIVNRFRGLDGTVRERIGGRILASRYYGAVAMISPYAQIISILLTGGVTDLLVGIDQQPTLSAGDISVTVI